MEQGVQTNLDKSKTNEFRTIEGFVLWWGAFILVGALAGVVWPLHWMPRCLFFRVTDYPCFTCGVTRSLKALAEGRFFDAWCLQPLMVVAGVGLGIGMMVCAFRRVRGCPGWEWGRIPTGLKWGLLILGTTAVVINWIYLLKTRCS